MRSGAGEYVQSFRTVSLTQANRLVSINCFEASCCRMYVQQSDKRRTLVQTRVERVTVLIITGMNAHVKRKERFGPVWASSLRPRLSSTCIDSAATGFDLLRPGSVSVLLTIAEALCEHIGSEDFEPANMAKIASDKGFKQHFTTAHSPGSNGVTERANRTTYVLSRWFAACFFSPRHHCAFGRRPSMYW